MGLEIFCDTITKSLDRGPDIVDITGDLEKILKESGIALGTLNATVIGSTGSITTIEYEEGVIEDLKDAIKRLAPEDAYYRHELRWHDGNGHSHVQAALMGPSIVVGVRNARLNLGTWQQVVVINHDNKPRQRKIDVTIIGLRP
ncbi:secondary thiamine-phosphate synthase enzyme [Dissulfuribacter thermophilus]|uniref:Secondary thiamine-phosphate synthase enzyme n=1 Tax=Dissulfuribacter thermophilus TaxID=1156395 RepID=A0A1B9F359_9BACT|nr:secondary thiamine-phosphate synthase enzyme YjbQ [Dissulfuribacter thermophilus]OCC14303.1 secondary thiamine-phosphate synthase enzyme [Dissulfuribacter thermophilus]